MLVLSGLQALQGRRYHFSVWFLPAAVQIYKNSKTLFWKWKDKRKTNNASSSIYDHTHIQINKCSKHKVLKIPLGSLKSE
jgi:hypothetical protein